MRLCSFSCFLFVWLFCIHADSRGAESPIDFGTQIRPILNRNCTGCHGSIKQAGDLSFIYREQALDAITPGKPEQSELIARITTSDPDDKMPPVDEHPEGLEPREIELLTNWVKQGAKWSDHWAFVKPQLADQLPPIKDAAWPRARHDHFILARLEAKNLGASPEANPAQWLRRASFDLTGLPPTPEEFREFLGGDKEKVRRGDNQTKALAENPVSSSDFLPVSPSPEFFDRAVEKLLASPHFGERWAQMWLDLVRYADTMGYENDLARTVWPYRDWLIRAFNDDMPFDQFTIKQIAGDLLPEKNIDNLVATICHRNSQTNVEGGTDDEQFRVAAVIDRINTTWTVWHGLTFGCVQCHSHPYDPFRHEDYYRFMSFFNNTEDCDINTEYPLLQYPKSNGHLNDVFALREEITTLRRELNEDGRQLAESGDIAWQKVENPELSTTRGKIWQAKDGRIRTGGTPAADMIIQVDFPARPVTALRASIFPQTEDPAKLPERGSVITKLTLTLIEKDGSEREIPLTDVVADTLSGPYDPIEATRAGAKGFGAYPKLFHRRWAVFPLEKPLDPPPGSKLRVSIQNSATTTGAQLTQVRRFAIETSGDPRWGEFTAAPRRKAKWQKYRELDKQMKEIPTVAIPVMAERPAESARETRLFVRGNWADKDELVSPGTPEILHAPKSKPASRLDLAEWLVDPENPLTARVFVNRVWAQLFGIGIVETLEDFGSSGELPSHPELLDDLAHRFQNEMNWSLKTLLRELVLSSTYRQDNRVSSQKLDADPRNRLLSRGPRTRLTAEMVRDQALTASGLLTRTQFGSPVMPPQPAGVWEGAFTGANKNRKWIESEGSDRYRRALYTYWKRTAPYPSFVTFDAPAREVCSPRRISTNTPLQALVTLNDPVYLEASRALGRRMDKAGIAAGYLAVVLSKPDKATTDELTSLYKSALAELESNFDKESQSLGATPREAALTIVANAIYNLDVALTK